MSTENKNLPDDVETTGHVWDGIQEFNNPLPRWWLWTFYATIIYSVIYMILYPAIPLVNSATPGVLGYSTRANVAADIQKFEEMNAPVEERLVAADLTAIGSDPELQNYSANAGKAVFNTWCAQCHGVEGGGVQSGGYPTLSDNDWLWGGSIEDIYLTVQNGIRNEQNPDARYSEMPAFGEILAEEEVVQVVQYVRKLSGQEFDAALADPGEALYLDNCAACHQDDGSGDRFQGAPNIADAIWLYGGSEEAITETVTNARFGVMPNWDTRLSEADIRAVSTYVHQLGGGE